jgi:hypothetical protein
MKSIGKRSAKRKGTAERRRGEGEKETGFSIFDFLFVIFYFGKEEVLKHELFEVRRGAASK